jgi:glycosyltransferase involved in cell wall biosynthesis
MGKAGRERALREFDWSTIARQTAEVYRELA